MDQFFKKKGKGKVVLGLCPIGKFVFSHEDALRQKNAIIDKLKQWNVDFVIIDGVIPDGMVRDQKHVDPVVKYFKEQNIDAVFVPHCNFGTEGAVGMIGRKLGLPLLLWGPRDESPLEDGSRYRDSLCGMFATSKVLRKLKVPFTYVENCGIEDKKFHHGVDTFIRAARVVKALKTMRIAQIGVRVDFFWTTIDNESELLEKFGIQVLPFDMADFLRAVKKRAEENMSAYNKELESYKSWLITDSMKDEKGLINGLALRDELLKIGEEEDISAFSIKSFTSIGTELGPGTGLGMSLFQNHYPVGVESDLHGAISSVLIEAASAVNEPSFLPEYTVRHPANDNAILLWHGMAPLALKHPDVSSIPIMPQWILKGQPPTNLSFRLKEGPVTVCRFDGDTDDYYLGIGEGKTIEGPDTREVHLWMEVNDWPLWERQIMEGPYIHHCSAVYDHCAHVLKEACRYIPGLKPQEYGVS